MISRKQNLILEIKGGCVGGKDPEATSWAEHLGEL
jgi:hypothetical protein